MLINDSLNQRTDVGFCGLLYFFSFHQLLKSLVFKVVNPEKCLLPSCHWLLCRLLQFKRVPNQHMLVLLFDLHIRDLVLTACRHRTVIDYIRVLKQDTESLSADL